MRQAMSFYEVLPDCPSASDPGTVRNRIVEMSGTFALALHAAVIILVLNWTGAAAGFKNHDTVMVMDEVVLLRRTGPASSPASQAAARPQPVKNTPRPVAPPKPEVVPISPHKSAEVKPPTHPEPEQPVHPAVQPAVASGPTGPISSLSANTSRPDGPVTTPAGYGHPGPVGPVETVLGAPDGPRFVRRVAPVYPLRARRQGLEGKVTLRLRIDEQGRATDIHVLEPGGNGFDEAASLALRESEYSPAMRQGRAVVSLARITVRFALATE